MCGTSIEILDCLKREQNIYIKTLTPSQNTALLGIPALIQKYVFKFSLGTQSCPNQRVVTISGKRVL